VDEYAEGKCRKDDDAEAAVGSSSRRSGAPTAPLLDGRAFVSGVGGRSGGGGVVSRRFGVVVVASGAVVVVVSGARLSLFQASCIQPRLAGSGGGAKEGADLGAVEEEDEISSPERKRAFASSASPTRP